MSKPAEAAACTQEASNLFPTSHNVLYMRGQIAELRGNMDEAKRWYEEALSINPTHVKSMQRLVGCCYGDRPFRCPTVQILHTADALAPSSASAASARRSATSETGSGSFRTTSGTFHTTKRRKRVFFRVPRRRLSLRPHVQSTGRCLRGRWAQNCAERTVSQCSASLSSTFPPSCCI